MVPPYSDRVSRAPPYSSSSTWPFRIPGYHRLWPAVPGCFAKTTRLWAVPRSLATTKGISVDFFSSGYLDISVHRVRFQQLCIHCRILPKQWVSPFGHRGINAYCQLPHAFRRLSRPSSPLTAKASTVCTYSLDHITPSRLGTTWLTLNYFALASRHV